MAEVVRVDIFSDVVCPWCYIGKRRFERAVARLAEEPSFPGVEVVYQPFQLDPHAPIGVAEPVADVYARKFGGVDRAAEVIAHVTAVAAGEGLDFHLERALRSNTADAHRLLWWALHTAGPTTQSALKEQLMRAYFTEGQDVGDADVLVECAERVGLDGAAVGDALADEDGLEALAVGLQQAAELGITAVPTFVVNSAWTIPGAQEADYFVRVLQRAA